MRGAIRWEDTPDPVVDATVLLFALDGPIPLGAAQTDRYGVWAIELPATGQPPQGLDVYVVVRDPSGHLLADTHETPLWVTGPDAAIDIVVDGGPRGSSDRPQIRVGSLLLDAEAVARAEPEVALDIVRSLSPAGTLTTAAVRRLTALSPLLASPDGLVSPLCDTAIMDAVHQLIELKGWPRELALQVDELLSLPTRGIPIHTHTSPNFIVTYCTTQESEAAGVDPDTSAQTVVEPGTTKVLTTLPAGGPPTYIKRVCYWLERALAAFTNPPFSLRNPAQSGLISIEVSDARPFGDSGATTFYINNKRSPECLACVCVHELFHRVQHQYPGLDDSGTPSWRLSMKEGGAVWAEDALMDAVNRYLFQAGVVGAFSEPGGLAYPHWSLEDPDSRYGSSLFWRYVAEQHSPQVPGAETYRQIIESCSAGSWSSDEIRSALRALPWHQDFYELGYLDSARQDLTSAETTLGNYALACYLKELGAHVPDRRFTFAENSANIYFDDLLRTCYEEPVPVVDTLIPVALTARETLTPAASRSFRARVARFGSRYFTVAVDPGVIGARVQFTAPSFTSSLFQIILIDETGAVREIYRTDSNSYTKQVPNALNGKRLDRIVLVVTGTTSSGLFSLTVTPMETAPDVMVTRWNSALGTEYEIDSRGWAWTWTSPDLWVAGNGGTVLPDVDNALTIRLHNKGNADASDISVQLDYQDASGTLSPTAWRPVQNRAGVTQLLVGLTLPMGASNQWSVDWSPISASGGDQFCVRATVTVPVDPNTDNKRALSSFGSVRLPPALPSYPG